MAYAPVAMTDDAPPEVLPPQTLARKIRHRRESRAALRRKRGWVSVREVLDLRGLTAQALATRLAIGVAWMDSEDLPTRALGLKALKLALEVRGDLVRQAAATLPSPPANLDVLVRVLHELRALPPPPVVVSEPGIVDITPLPAQAPENTDKPS